MDTSSTTTAATPRKKMSAEVFMKIWTGEMEVKGTEWEEFVNFKGWQVVFLRIEVEDEIWIDKNEKSLIPVKLSNCHLANFNFKNAKFGGIEIIDDSKIKDFTINNSTTGSFWISNSTTGRFLIHSSKTGKFSIDNSTIGGVKIDNSTTEELRIDNSTTGEFSIGNSKTGQFHVSLSTTGSVWIYNSTTGSFDVLGSWIKSINIALSETDLVEFSDGNIGFFRCYFLLQKSVHLIFKNSRIEHLDFKDAVFPEFTTISISNCEANRLSFHNSCNYGTAFFSNLKPLDWEEINKLPEEKRSVFSEAGKDEPPSTLHFFDSDLGKMQFINCDLRKFDRFEFSNTKMLDVFVAGSQMPDASSFCLPGKKVPKSITKRTVFYKLIIFINRIWRLVSIILKRGIKPIRYKSDSTRYEQQRLAYSQFKKIYEARGDIAGSLPYLAYEMEAYRQQLQMEGWWKNQGELVMLWANKLSSNYGNSWSRAFLGTLAATAFGYGFYCLSLGFWFGTDLKTFIKLASYGLQYVNPFSDPQIPEDLTNLIPKPSDSHENWMIVFRILDYITRFFVAYFVYQTIQAFRKLGKSSG